ncbi:MAG: HEAT repeat domain-containing protein [Pyrinomonadaceae bacterium]
MKQRPFNSIAIRRGWLIAAIASSFVVLAGGLTGGAAQDTNQKRVESVRVGSTTEGSRVVVVSDSALNDYEAYKRGDRFYVKLPAANLASAQSGFRGTGFEDAQVQKVADGVILSFRLQPGTTARVDQRLNKLDVVFSTSGIGRSRNSANANRSALASAASSGQSSNAASGLAATGSPESVLSPIAQTQLSPSSEPPAQNPGIVAGSQAAPVPGGAVGAWLSRYWFVPLIAMVLLVALAFVILARKRSAGMTSSRPQRSNQPLEQPGNDAETAFSEPDIAAPSPPSPPISLEEETWFTGEQLATVPLSSEPGGIKEKRETTPPMSVSHSLEANPLISDQQATATPVSFEQIDLEVEKLLAGGEYDQDLMADADGATRQLITARLVSALGDRSSQQYENARQAFLNYGYFDEAIRELRVAESPALRAAAATKLGRVGNTRAAPHLMAALHDSAPEVRKAAVESLGQLGDPAAVWALNDLASRETSPQLPETMIRHAINCITDAVSERAEQRYDDQASQTYEHEVLREFSEAAPLPEPQALEESTDSISPMPPSTTLPSHENDWRSGEARRQLKEEALLNAVEELERRSQAAEENRRKAEEEARQKIEGEKPDRTEDEAHIRLEEEARSPAEPEATPYEGEEEARPATEMPGLQQPEGEAHFGPEEEVRFRLEAEALRRAGEERARQRAAAEAARRLADEGAQRRAEEALRRQAQEGTHGRVEESIRRRLEEQARNATEEEALRRAEDERLKLEAEERRRFSAERLKLEQEALMEAAAELTRRRSEAEEVRKKAEEEARLLQETQQRIQAEEERRRQIEEERLRLEEEARRRAEEERQRLEEMRRRVEGEQQKLEETRLRAEQEEQRLAELEAVKKQAEQRTLERAEQEQRIRAEIEALRQAEMEQRKRIEAETRRRTEAEARLREEEARREASEQARLKFEEEARRLAEEAHQRAEHEINLRAAAEARLKEEEARREAAEEARLKAEEETHRLADEEALRRAEAAARFEEEEVRRRSEEERRKLEEKSQRLAEEARLRSEEEADRRAAAEARLKEERARRQAEEGVRNQTEGAALRLAQEARRRKEEEVRRRLGAEARLIDQEARREAAEEERLKAEENARLQGEENRLQSAADDQEARAVGASSADVNQKVEAPWIDVSIEPEGSGESLSGDQSPPANPHAEQVPAPPGPAQESSVESSVDHAKISADLLKRLNSNELGERAAALRQLSQVNSDDAFTIVSNAFDDQAVEVRNAAAQALYDMQEDRAASFTRALREGSPERRRKIGSALATSGLARDAMANLTGESREKTYDAFSLLFLMAKAGEVQPLLQAIEDHPNIEVRLAVIKLLALSGQAEIVPAFRRLAVRGSLPSEVRSAVMEAIYQISSQARESAPSVA